ncbi:hypothetical protein [Acrocarpospora catenulata]|uniref:hypothetical protein n=1 Tax=Acrocarpospora catenulata TaxID=2836182 RepID=UPI001BDB1D44|nr:hypothetical protein [Acrocarpospora catenulata]
MTGSQAAALLWASGIGPYAWHSLRMARAFLAKDPLFLCDECRERRREGNLLSAMPDALMAVCMVLAAMLWPGLLIRSAVRRLMGKPRHRCDRAPISTSG